jgi:Tfp pilus assembly ATPase PilU
MQKNCTIEGLISFDRHIFDLYSQNLISDEVAVRYATSPNDMGLKLRGFAG